MIDLFWGIGLYWIFGVFTIGILLFVFWLWMFIEALKKRDVLWIILFLVGIWTVLFGLLFALLYYFLEYETDKNGSKKK